MQNHHGRKNEYALTAVDKYRGKPCKACVFHVCTHLLLLNCQRSRLVDEENQKCRNSSYDDPAKDLVSDGVVVGAVKKANHEVLLRSIHGVCGALQFRCVAVRVATAAAVFLVVDVMHDDGAWEKRDDRHVVN